MCTREGRLLLVQSSTVRIDMADGPANLSILSDVTEQQQARVAMSAAKEQAEAANRGKSRFLANMSHEVRTPLNGIYGLAQLALADELPAPRRQDYLRQIVGSAEHLTGLLTDVLDLSKIEAGELKLERIAFDLHALLEAVAAGYRGLAAEKSLSFALEIDATLPRWVRGDPTRTRQIIANYLSNALKFTSGGSIALRAGATDGDTVRLAVADTGIGVDAATQARLFKPFIQADDSTTRRYGGTGLGLSICGELAALLGGRVGIDSAPGQGSSFWVELPLPAAPADEGAGAEDRAVDEAPLAQALAAVRLLVVEDNPVNMMIALAMLERWGTQVTPASDGRQAIDAFDAAAGAFDAVLMDLHMPVMDGLDATAELRRRRSADELPIIAMTAAVLEQDLSDAYQAGMNDFVSKPFAADRLLATIARWTVRRRDAALSA
jgi:signal transduction histidine kinase/ActR/RegA family two-component response regulator